MTRRTFFSFHYERDIFRANVVRNSWVTQDRQSAGFWDASLWEDAKRTGDDTISRMILNGLSNTTVTVVLIGTDTANRQWINFEIIESYNRGNGILGVYIHNIKSIPYGYIDPPGKNPFNFIYLNNNGAPTYFSEIFPTYDYVNNNGYVNMGSWIESAARAVGK